MRPVGSKYLLEESLGRGATGTVWRGRVREDAAVPGLLPGQAVAVKVLREELAADPDVVMRFLRERSVLLRLTHPNIVRTRDLVVEGELLALVMDLVDGPDLYRYLRESGPLSPIAGALLMAQIADALAASHADGVVHRDLKPANVLLATLAVDGDERMHPMLTDFGIARLADSPGITRTHEFVGTPVYVAPESADGRPQTAAVDVYGAGIMLYELVTGRPPFQGDNPLAVLQAHLAHEPQRPRTMPEPLWTVVERCLRKDPAQRPTAVSLAEALRVVAAGVGVHSSPAAVDAALAVGDLLVPDPALAAPAPAGAHDATLAGIGYDPAAATQVMAHQPPVPGTEDRTQLIAPQPPAAPPAERTRVMPAVPPAPEQAPAQPEGPHPWQTQLRAARDRNAQTRIGYFEPDGPGEPQVAPRPYQAGQQPPPGYPQPGSGGRPPVAPPPYQRPAQDGRYAPQQGPYQPQQPPPGGHPQQGRGQGRGGRPPVAPPPYQAQQQPGYGGQPGYEAPPNYGAPQRRAEPPAPQRRPEPEPPREREREREREPRRRSPNRMRIPGLGCLKGCLLVLVVLAVGCLALWNFTPLPHYWDNVVGWYDSARTWVTSHT